MHTEKDSSGIYATQKLQRRVAQLHVAVFAQRVARDEHQLADGDGTPPAPDSSATSASRRSLPAIRCCDGRRPRRRGSSAMILSSALGLHAALAATSAAVQPPLPSLLPPSMHLAFAPGSAWSVVFNRTKDGCDLHDGVDSMPAAFHSRRENLTYFWGAVGVELRPSTGRTLDDLRHDCSVGSIFNATLAQTPQSWANYQWLQSVHILANGTAFALIHNEFVSSWHCAAAVMSLAELTTRVVGCSMHSTSATTCPSALRPRATAHIASASTAICGPPASA
jgi:hypothetical protein